MTTPTCLCGCGRVIRNGSRFAPGHNNPKLWTVELIVGAIRRWTSEHDGSPPAFDVWNRAGVPRDEFPAATTVKRVFGSWHAALAEAGVPTVREPRWTAERIVAAIQRWTTEHDGSPPQYVAWDRAGTGRHEFPSTHTVKRVFGSWHAALAEAGVPPVRAERWRTLDAAFGHWLAGLVDGEGCFTVTRRHSGAAFSPRFTMRLRDDDSAILDDIQLRLGLGSIHRAAGHGNSMPCCVWDVQSGPDTEELAEVLDRYPLRSKKAADYAIWRKAVELWSAMRSGHRRSRRERDWGPMVQLKQELESVRRYQSGALACRMTAADRNDPRSKEVAAR